MADGDPARRTLNALAWAAGLALAAAWAWRPVSDGDVWWHLAAGRELALHRGFPAAEPFAFTVPAGTPWNRYEWLFSLAAFGVYRLGGMAALGAAKAALLLGAFALCALRGLRRGAGTFSAVFFALWALGASRLFFNERPHVVSFFLFTAALLLLEAPERLRWRRPAFWALAAIWANFHGAALLALPLALLRAACGRKKDPWLPAGTALALLASPLGWTLFSAALAHQRTLAEGVREWLSPLHPAAFAGAWPGLALLAAAAAALAARPGRSGRENFLWDLGAFGLLAPLALLSQRHLPFFCLWAAPAAASRLAAAWGALPARLRRAEPALKLALLTLGGLAAGGQWASASTGLGVPQGKYPKETLEYLLASGLEARVFNDYTWGGWLIWRAGPKIRVFIDGRLLFVYPARVIEEYQAAAEGEDWEEVFERYGVEAALVRLPSRLARSLSEAGGWFPTAFDDQSILYLKDLPRFRGLIRASAPVGWKPGRLEAPFSGGRLDLAEKDLARRLALQPGLGILHFYRAALFKARGRADLARAQLEQGIARDPGFAPNYNWLGMELFLSGAPEKARSLWLRSLRLREDALVRDWLRGIPAG